MTFKNHHFLPRSIIPWIAFSLKIVFVKRRQKNTISARKFLLIVHFLSNYIQISLFCVWNITSRVENSELPQARETPSGKERIQNCDFSRCRLNVRLTAYIQPLLRGHKYRVWFLFGSCLWRLEENQNSCWRDLRIPRKAVIFQTRFSTSTNQWNIKDWHTKYYYNITAILQ